MMARWEFELQLRVMLGKGVCLAGHRHATPLGSLTPDEQAGVTWAALMLEFPDLPIVGWPILWLRDPLLVAVRTLARELSC